MVYRISFHYYGNREDAEDVSQDVFVKLYGGNFNPESEEELKAWLIRVTTNACHNYFRNPFRKRKTEIDEKELENIIGILPPTSSFLPFFSAGGSNLILCYAFIGIAMSIYRYKNVYPQHNRINQRKVVNI